MDGHDEAATRPGSILASGNLPESQLVSSHLSCRGKLSTSTRDAAFRAEAVRPVCRRAKCVLVEKPATAPHTEG